MRWKTSIMKNVLLECFMLLFPPVYSCMDCRPATLDDILPPNYDKMKPPKVQNGTELSPVNVTIHVYVLQMGSVNEIEMSLKMDIFLREYWMDSRLKYPENVDGDHVVLDSDWSHSIWTPRLWFKNAMDVKLQQWLMPSMYYWLDEKKIVGFSSRLTLELSCDMDLYKFPHDTQHCGVEIIALLNPSQDLVLNWQYPSSIRVSRLLTLPQFDVGEYSLGRCDTVFSSGMFSCIKVYFEMKRRPGYFIINIYVPTVLIVLMSMLTFWIPPHAVPARVTLGVTSLLTIITKQYQSTMPSVSYVIALNVWLSMCIAFVFCSLIEYAVVISLLARSNRMTQLDQSDQFSSSGSIRSAKALSSAWIEKKWKTLLGASPLFVDVISRFLFPIAFVICCFIYYGQYIS